MKNIEALSKKEILEKLDNGNVQTHKLLASTQKLPEFVYFRLEDDYKTLHPDDVSVRVNLAKNRKIPEKLYLILAKDKAEQVRWHLASNPEIPEKVFDILKEDREDKIRLSLADNLKVPKNILQELTQDKNNTVKDKAQEKLNKVAKILKIVRIAMAMKDIKVPDEKSLGIPRRNMPQVHKKHLDKFMKWLKKEGVNFSETKIKLKKLKPTQKDFNLKKVMDTININREKLKKPLLVSKDNYIIDGHHKWLAHINLKDKNKKVSVIQADLSAKDFLAKARQFSKVKYKDVEDNVYKKIDKKQKYAKIEKIVKKKFANNSIKVPLNFEISISTHVSDPPAIFGWENVSRKKVIEILNKMQKEYPKINLDYDQNYLKFVKTIDKDKHIYKSKFSLDLFKHYLKNNEEVTLDYIEKSNDEDIHYWLSFESSGSDTARSSDEIIALSKIKKQDITNLAEMVNYKDNIDGDGGSVIDEDDVENIKSEKQVKNFVEFLKLIKNKNIISNLMASWVSPIDLVEKLVVCGVKDIEETAKKELKNRTKKSSSALKNLYGDKKIKRFVTLVKKAMKEKNKNIEDIAEIMSSELADNDSIKMEAYPHNDYFDIDKFGKLENIKIDKIEVSFNELYSISKKNNKLPDNLSDNDKKEISKMIEGDIFEIILEGKYLTLHTEQPDYGEEKEYKIKLNGLTLENGSYANNKIIFNKVKSKKGEVIK